MSKFEINEFSLHLGHTDPDNEVGELMLDPATLFNMAHNQEHPDFDANLAASWADGALQPLNDAATQPDFFGPNFEFYTDQSAILSNLTGADVGTGPLGFGQASSSYSFIDNSSYNILGDGDVEPIYQGSFDFRDDVNQLPFAQNAFNFQASHNLSVASGLTQVIPVVSAQHHLPQKQQRKAKKKSSSQRKKPRKRTTFDWAAMEPHLLRLYLKKDHTIAELAFELPVLYGFTAAHQTLQKKLNDKFNIRKNNTRKPASDVKKNDRRRPAQSFRARLTITNKSA
ncbi:hypothetical protein TsFJ059_010200 [Trichoderma semiorbis]|uniref:Uncharacterized protein n=1 Tax=Trichoderma semiorbis TaxID=1491008 RepID=A0A9P8HFL3_9HYPO|nr:hypothetical protein TsFJ059_010200 [Trichoderma semiorbis]